MNKNIYKSIWAVFAGFAVVAILSVITDMILEKFGVFPPQSNPEAYLTWMLALALVYRSIYTLVGGYVTARLAPHSPMKHVFNLIILGTAGGLFGLLSNWNLGNHWYPIALVITGPFFIWIGGKIYNKKTLIINI